MLEIEVVEMEGKYPVYRWGDKFVFNSHKIILNKSDDLCANALSPFLHNVVAFDEGVDPKKLGLTKQSKPDYAYMLSVESGPPPHRGGRVIFKGRKIQPNSTI